MNSIFNEKEEKARERATKKYHSKHKPKGYENELERAFQTKREWKIRKFMRTQKNKDNKDYSPKGFF